MRPALRFLASLLAASAADAETMAERDERQREKDRQEVRNRTAEPNAPLDQPKDFEWISPEERERRDADQKREAERAAEEPARREAARRAEEEEERRRVQAASAAIGREADRRQSIRETELAIALLDGPSEPDPAAAARAARQLEIAAAFSETIPAAKAAYGWILVQGRFGRRDADGFGRKLMRQGIDGGCPPYYLSRYARALEEGLGGPVEAVEARGWYRAHIVRVDGSAQGAAEARHRLGAMDETGRGAKADVASALRWYREAAALGYEPSRLRLALMQRDGIGMPADAAAARVAFEALLLARDPEVAAAASAALRALTP